MTTPFYVAPEQVMKDRADYARKGIARGRALVAIRYDDGIAHRRREPVRDAAQGQRDLRPDRLRRRRQVQRVRPAARRRRPRRRPQGIPVLARRCRRPHARQPVRPDPRQHLHPRDEADGGRDPRRRGRRRADGDQMFHILYDGTVMDQKDFTVLGGDAEAIGERLARRVQDGLDLGCARCGSACAALAGPDRRSPSPSSRSPTLTRGNGRRCFSPRRRRRASCCVDRPARRSRCTLRPMAAIDLNADLGEWFGVWRLGDDDADARRRHQRQRRLRVPRRRPVHACVACARQQPTAASRSAPRSSYPDLLGFGRRFIDIDPGELRDAVLYQLGALDAFAQVAGTGVAYVKPHGALYHACISHRTRPKRSAAAAHEYDPSLAVLAAPGSPLLAVADALGHGAGAGGVRRPAYRSRRHAAATHRTGCGADRPGDGRRQRPWRSPSSAR